MPLARKHSLYAQLEALPEGLTGEIVNGQLYAHPRPAPAHLVTESALGVKIGGPYGFGDGGPGGWWILVEPEIHFVPDREVCVPDLAGWRRERMPVMPETACFQVVPDWLCEVLSPSTKSMDREVKMPLYAHYGVHYAWLVDPSAKTLEAFELRGGAWVEIGHFRDRDTVSVAPFDAITIQLQDLWA